MTRVEDLVEEYMRHYEVGFDQAIDMMIEDLGDAKKDDELRGDLVNK